MRRGTLAPATLALVHASIVITLLAASGAAASEPRRVVAVGDIHGAYDQFVRLLAHIGLTDERGQWRGGDSILVQTGDFLDRGARALEVAELLMRLEREATSAGGEVHVLLGNHEVMNLLGDLRDVHPSIYASLADEESEKRRQRLCRQAIAIVRHGNRGGPSPPYGQLMNRCLEGHPPGRIEYIELLAADGWLGRWLRTLPAVHQQAGTVFLHGGLNPELAADGIAMVNQRVREEISAWDSALRWFLDHQLALPTSGAVGLLSTARQLTASGELVSPAVHELAKAEDWLLINPEGPLWLRGYARWDDAEGSPRVGEILSALGARRLVVGHTPQSSRGIERRFGGRVLLIDTGMLSEVYGGRPSALEITGPALRAVYLDGSQPLDDGEDEPAPATMAATDGGSRANLP